MPIYVYECQCGTRFEQFLPVARYLEPQTCSCGKVAEKQITRPMIFVQPDICYDSPIDGRPITSMAARMEDLARSNCVPYDPDQKTDYNRRVKEGEAALEAKMEATVEAEIERMPARKRERMQAELDSGIEVETGRYTAPAKPVTTEIHHV